MLVLATSLGAPAREGGGQREQTGDVEVRQPDWGRYATESSLMLMLWVVAVVVAGYEGQKLEQGRVLGGSLGLQRSSQQQQQFVVLLPKMPCAAASGAQETDQQRLFCPLDPWPSSAAVEEMSSPQKGEK